ncbi:uncharacterized protein LOC117120882 [Anneissia japonica]|uniref:uncharacterized protein LOC117120882 n=1 Tax=Anneissia japonica TaxID=1529436 RepID=UPI00142563F9|nr:uncharacterized protein LOC117120882 [Anneissia japonica]
MECDTRFTWIIVLCLLCKLAIVDGILLLKGPEDKTVYEGDTVTFECTVASKGGIQILWVFGRASFISVDTKILSYMDHGLNTRSSIINGFEGQYKLQISNVSMSDEGTFGCYYSQHGSTGNFSEHGEARLTVLKFGTRSPVCSVQNSDLPRRPYQKLVLNCLSASKNFTVKWDNGTDSMTRFHYGWQNVQVVLTPYDNGRVFTCTELNPATFRTQNCSIKPMNIFPTATILPGLPTISADNDITFVCNASGLPNISKYVWIHNGHVIARGLIYPMKYTVDGRTLTIRGVDMSDHQSSIVCQAYVQSGMYGVARTTMVVLPTFLTTSTSLTTPLTIRQSTHIITDVTRDIPLENDGNYPISIFPFSLPAVVASVIGISVLIIISVSLLMFVCLPRRKPMLELPDVTARRGRSPGTFVPSISRGISHNNFLYAELSNEIDLQKTEHACEYLGQSLREEEVLQPLIDEHFHLYSSETQSAAESAVPPPLPPKPTRLIAPDLYAEIPEEIYQECDDYILYWDTELPVRSSSETIDNFFQEPDYIGDKIHDSAALIVDSNIPGYCQSNSAKRRSGNVLPCGCDEKSRATCTSYARVKKTNRKYRAKGLYGDYTIGNLERNLLIPLKCDDLTSAGLYDAHTELLDFQTERELCLNKCYSDPIYDVIPENAIQHHHQTMLLPSSRCRSRLRRSKSCPKNNPYEDTTDKFRHPLSFVSDLRVAESAPDLVHAQLNTKGHNYEMVPEKALNALCKAKSDDILSKASSYSSSAGDSSDYVDMGSNGVNDYI